MSVYDAKTQLSQLLARVERGEHVVITRNGKPVARLAPLDEPARVPGVWHGQVRIHDDFDDLTDADLRDWYGG